MNNGMIKLIEKILEDAVEIYRDINEIYIMIKYKDEVFLSIMSGKSNLNIAYQTEQDIIFCNIPITKEEAFNILVDSLNNE